MFHRGLFACLLAVLVASAAPAQRFGYRPPPVRTYTPAPPIRPVGGVAYHPTYVNSSGGSSGTSDSGGSWWDRWGLLVIAVGVLLGIVVFGIVTAVKGDPPVSAAQFPTATRFHPVAPPPPQPPSTVLVRVTGVPEGEAPEWVRRAWVGLVLPALDNRPVRGQEVVTGRRSFAPAFQVTTSIALALLEVGNQTAAAEWWRQNTAHANDPSQHFLFSPDCCSPLG